MQRESSLGYFGMVTFVAFLGWWVHVNRTPVTSEGIKKKVTNWITVSVVIPPNQKKWHDWKKNVKNTFLQFKFLILCLGNKNQISQYPGIEAYLVFISRLEKNETCRIIYIIRAKYLSKMKKSGTTWNMRVPPIWGKRCKRNQPWRVAKVHHKPHQLTANAMFMSLLFFFWGRVAIHHLHRKWW